MQHRSFILYLFISSFYCEVMQSSFLIEDQKLPYPKIIVLKTQFYRCLKKPSQTI